MSLIQVSESALAPVMKWVVSVDVPRAEAEVETLRRKYPAASRHELAERAFNKRRWKAAGVGFASGLPANLLASVPAAVGDIAAVLKAEVQAAAVVALIYDPEFFEEEDAAWELLLPILGIDAVSQLLRELGVRAGTTATRRLIRKYLSKETLALFKKVMLRYFGMKVTQKGVITKTVPVVGGLIGGGWNWLEVSAVRKRTIAYFENQELGEA